MDSPLTRHTQLRTTWLGHAIDYGDGMAKMRHAMEAVAQVQAEAGQLLLLEHRPTITVTRQGGLGHLRVSPEALAEAGLALVETDRGGDVTFHGPGQLVGYPIVRLCEAPEQEGGAPTAARVDLVGYLRALEAGLLRACQALGVRGAHTKPGMTGIWVASQPDRAPATWVDDDEAAKLVAIGVGVRRGVTRHGFALNLDIDLPRYTERIVPCGLAGRPVTSWHALARAGQLAPDAPMDLRPGDPALHRLLATQLAASLGLIPTGIRAPAGALAPVGSDALRSVLPPLSPRSEPDDGGRSVGGAGL